MSRAAAAALILAAPLAARGADALADLEAAQTALFDAVAPAVVVVESGKAIGAGFAVAPGLVLTAGHVVGGAEQVTVTLAGGRVVAGTVVERSREGLDLALVRVAAETPRTLALAPAAPRVRTGSFVASVGHGDGARWTLATGLVANAAADGPDGALLRLQLPLRPGASGGPVVDRAGRVLGIVTHGAPGAVAFAVRADAALRSLAGLAALPGGDGAPPAAAAGVAVATGAASLAAGEPDDAPRPLAGAASQRAPP